MASLPAPQSGPSGLRSGRAGRSSGGGHSDGWQSGLNWFYLVGNDELIQVYKHQVLVTVHIPGGEEYYYRELTFCRPVNGFVSQSQILVVVTQIHQTKDALTQKLLNANH